ncbi:MAG: elongation factor Ts [Caulobacteraceae bacterium]|nr:elongation factor Ts [Caulobacter sp.]
MAEITAQLVKELREKSGAGMMDCKKALTETGGDLEAAMDWLRTKGLSKAAKKSDRVAAEGLVAVALRDEGQGMVGAVVEVNAETDFVARNELFQNAAKKVARAALDTEIGPELTDVQALNEAPVEGGETVQAMLTNLIANIGENMVVRRAKRFVVPEGVVAAYVHNAVATDLGRIGVLVALESAAADHAALTDLGRKIGMHIAATSPLSLSTDDLDPAAVERERAIFSEQAQQSGKPPQVIEKMVEGRIRKFYEEVVLTKQAFVMNPDQTIEQLLVEQGKALGAPIKLAGFIRLALGEGVEKKTDDFAAEVASLTGATA